jgi:hypothetical protein
MHLKVANLEVPNKSAWNKITICYKKSSKNCTKNIIKAIGLISVHFIAYITDKLVKFILNLAEDIRN